MNTRTLIVLAASILAACSSNRKRRCCAALCEILGVGIAYLVLICEIGAELENFR